MKYVLLILLFATLMIGRKSEAIAEEKPTYSIIPRPAKLTPKTGKFVISKKTQLIFTAYSIPPFQRM